MKIETNKYGRRIYKFSSSIVQGGYLYAHKTKQMAPIKNREGLCNLLNAIAKKYELIDVTIKVYRSIFFLFFQVKPSLRPQKLIDAIQEQLGLCGEWDEAYLWTGVYDLQEKHVKQYLEKNGYEWEEG